MTRVLVLNASFEPLHVATVRRAAVLVLMGKAEVLEDGEGVLRAETMTLSVPAVIRLLAYVTVPAAYRRRITRRAVFARDSWTCQYCGSTGRLTVDHVIPRASGGKTSWGNVTTCCAPCNARKSDFEPSEVGMKLARKPRVPPRDVFVFVAVKSPPPGWMQYLFRK